MLLSAVLVLSLEVGAIGMSLILRNKQAPAHSLFLLTILLCLLCPIRLEPNCESLNCECYSLNVDSHKAKC